MFDVGFWELILVGMVALLAFGPKELPHLVRGTVRVMRKLRAAASIAGEELRRELQLDELDLDNRTPRPGSPMGHVQDVVDEVRQITNEARRRPPPTLSRHSPEQDDEQA